MFRKTKNLFVAVFLTSTFFAIHNIYNNEAFAHTATVNASGTINLPVSASGNGANVVKDEITVSSSCPLGYTLSISGPTDSALYKDGDNTSTKKINASAGTKTTPASILTNKNTWGYAIGSNITINSNFIGLTNAATEIASASSASATGGDKFSIFYGVSVDTTIEPGEYKLAESSAGAGDNVITYYLTTDPACNTYAIRYNENGANSTSKMGNQTVDTTTDLTLWASNFKNPNNKGFAGWNTKADGTGKSYGPNETISQSDLNTFLETNAIVDNGAQYVDLYAIWVDSAGDLQGWTGCSAMNIGDVTALKDARDNNTYAVAKLADGKCWMIENLRLDDTATLTTLNTNDPRSDDGINAALKNTDGTITNHLSASTDPPTTTAWCMNDAADCIDQSMLYAGNTTNPVTNMNKTDDNIYSYGNYYNWYSATAGRGMYSMSAGNTDGDICPKSWHLPTAGGGSDIATLIASSGSNTGYASEGLRTYPTNFIYSGHISGSSINRRGEGGMFSSSTAHPADYLKAFMIGLHPILGVQGNANKYDGISVRCVANETYTITFNSNGGSGDMTDQIVYVGQNTNLNSNTFIAPSGKQFSGWNTDANGNGASYADGAEVEDLTTAGQTITLYAQWSASSTSGCPANSICYDDNGVNSPTTMSNQSIAATDTEATLWASNFKTSADPDTGIGYGFAGWNTKSDGTGTNYGPNETINFSAGAYSTEGLQLYANWIEYDPDVTPPMQVFGREGTCAGLNIGDVISLMDNRDGDIYAVAKLADGNCWMIENLRLGGNNDYDLYLTPSDTNISSNFTLPYIPASSTPSWCTDNTAACIDQTLLYIGNTANTVADMTDPSENVYSYGNYYNWYAATAGNGTYATTAGDKVTEDICPSAWRMASSENFEDLYNILNDGSHSTNADLVAYPYNVIYSGYIHGGSQLGAEGVYWSNFASSNNAAGVFYTNIAEEIVFGSTEKYRGLTVRCMTAG